ncbi:MAG: hypothetical protein M3512_17615 [Bacteroidota bacterium]|nr:hypothetical protein [Bacteroidota bacterium]
MRTIYILLFALALAFTCFNKVSADVQPIKAETDTIVINFGNRSKIVIFVDSKQDFETLKNYDLNAMLRDLSITIDSTQEDFQVLQIEDSTGTRYLSDTTIVISQKQDEDREVGTNNEIIVVKEDTVKDVNIRIGRYSIKIFNNEKNITVEKDNSYRRTKHAYNIDFGMNNYMNNGRFPDETNELYTVRPFGSWYVALSSIRKTHVGGPLNLEWGGNVSWYNFKFQNNSARIVKEDVSVRFYEADPTIRAIKSKLMASYINLSLVPVLDFSSQDKSKGKEHHVSAHGFRIGLGGYAGYRIGSRSKFVYSDNGRQKEKDRDNFFLNNWRYGMRMQLGYRGLDLFVNYDLHDLFILNNGPKLNAFSFGITI